MADKTAVKVPTLEELEIMAQEVGCGEISIKFKVKNGKIIYQWIVREEGRQVT